MVQTGSSLEYCCGCKAPRVCGEFYLLSPLLRIFLCAACLELAAAGVRAAESREPVQPARSV